MKNRNLEHKDNWATPKEFYNKLDAEFHFDFDPCPLNSGEITHDKDGLLIEWGQRNYINPPYSRKLKEAFVRKAVEESRGGKPWRKVVRHAFAGIHEHRPIPRLDKTERKRDKIRAWPHFIRGSKYIWESCWKRISANARFNDCSISQSLNTKPSRNQCI